MEKKWKKHKIKIKSRYDIHKEFLPSGALVLTSWHLAFGIAIIFVLIKVQSRRTG